MTDLEGALFTLLQLLLLAVVRCKTKAYHHTRCAVLLHSHQTLLILWQFCMLSVLAIYLVATTQKIDSALHCWMEGALEQLI